MICPTLEALLSDLIDYAGLFPPAELEMEKTVDEFARQRLGAAGWMLSRLVVPVSRLTELERAAADYLPREASGESWRIAALASDSFADDRSRIDAFNERHAETAAAGRIRVDAVEARTPDVAAVGRAAQAFAGLQLYCEVPWDAGNGDGSGAILAAIGDCGTGVAAKVRTGGVTPEAIPDSASVARFLLTAAAAGVSFKATAGLHHALRGEYPLTYAADSPRATLHGFLNLFLTAVLARQGSVDERDLRRLLEAGTGNEGAPLEADEREIRWQGHTFDLDSLIAGRRFARSYGSCSFREPLAELQDLGLLPAGDAEPATR